jgi:hypothetical protein
MSKEAIIRLIFQAVGIFYLIPFVTEAYSSISMIWADGLASFNYVWVVLGAIGVKAGLIYFFIIKPHQLVAIITPLMESNDEEISIDIKPEKWIQLVLIAIAVTGLYHAISRVLTFVINRVYLSSFYENPPLNSVDPIAPDILLQVLKIVIALLILVNSKRLATWISSKNNSPYE